MADRWIEYVPLSDIVPAEENPKGHDVPAIAASIDRFGYTEPSLVDERTGRLVAGHGRTESLGVLHAAREAGLAPPDGVRDVDGVWHVPIVRGWASVDDAHARAYLLASNQLVPAGGWDNAGVLALIDRIEADQPDLTALLGWTDEELAVMRAEFDHPYGATKDPDDVPEPPTVPVTKKGDLWLLGGHTVCPKCKHHNPVGG